MTQEELSLKKGLMRSRSLHDHFRSLLAVLGKEADLWRELREIIIGERETIKRPSLEDLHGLNTRKETVIWKLKMLEEVRAGYVRKIGRTLGIPEREINLSALSAEAGGAFREAFQSCREEMGQLLGEIRERNRTNQDLLDVSASLLRGTIDFMQELAAGNSCYSQSGRLTPAGRNGRILQTKG